MNEDMQAHESGLRMYESEIALMDNSELTCLSGVLYFNRALLEDYEIYDRLLDARNARVKELGYTEPDQNCDMHIQTQTSCMRLLCKYAEKIKPTKFTHYEWWNGVTGGRT